MSIHVTETSAETAEIRYLTSAELDEVNGGVLGFVLAGIWCFGAGLIYGATRDTGMEWTVGQLLDEINAG